MTYTAAAAAAVMANDASNVFNDDKGFKISRRQNINGIFFFLLLLSILLLKCPERSLSCARHSASVAYKAIFISDNYFAAAA